MKQLNHLPHLLYLVGLPGSGKTTLLHAALERTGWTEEAFTQPFAHSVYRSPDSGDLAALYLGKRRDGGFGGTDALPMHVQPAVLRFLEEQPTPLVVGEGDRLGNASFFAALSEMGYVVSIVYVHVPLEVAEQRRDRRGSNQDATWLRGRMTKTDRLAMDSAVVLDGTLPVERNLDELCQLLVPANDLLKI